MASEVEVNLVYFGRYEVIVRETNAGASDTVPIPGLPIYGAIIRVQCQLLGGTGTTVNPILGRVTNPGAADQEDVVVVPVAPADVADVIDKCGNATYLATTVDGDSGTLYHQSRPDAGSDNSVTTVYHVEVGWAE